MIVKLLTEQHSEFLSLKGGCRGSSESESNTLVKCNIVVRRKIICRIYPHLDYLSIVVLYSNCKLLYQKIHLQIFYI